MVGFLGVVTGAALTVSGVCVTAFIAYRNAQLGRFHEERKQVRDIATQLGLKQWEARIAENIRKASASEKQTGRTTFIPDPKLDDLIDDTYKLVKRIHQCEPEQGLFCRLLDCLRGDCICKK